MSQRLISAPPTGPSAADQAISPRGRVLQVTAHYAPHTGGIETHVREVAHRLRDRGWQVEVVTTSAASSAARHSTVDGTRVTRRRRWPRERDWCFAPGVVFDVLTRDVDVVHIQGVHTFVAPLAMLAAIVRRVPFVVTLHTGGHSSPARRRIRDLQWLILRPLLWRAERVVAVCEWEIERFSDRLGLPSERMALVRNGSGMNDSPRPVSAAPAVVDDEFLVLSIGRLERYKGHHRVLTAMPSLLDRRPARLVIVGSGPYEAELREQIASAGLEQQVEMTTFAPERRAELAALIGRADVTVLMSEYEAHPVAVMEALGLGCPVVVAETSGLTELARSGWVRSVPLDAGAAQLARAIERCAADGAPTVHLPTWDDCTDQLEGLYSSCLDAPASDASERGAVELPRAHRRTPRPVGAPSAAPSVADRHTRLRDAPWPARRRPRAPGSSTTGTDRTIPVLAVLAVALVVHALAGLANQTGASSATALYWSSLVVMFAVVAWRVARSETPAHERLVISVGLAVALFLSRAVLAPHQFSGHDDLVHLTTLRLIHENHRLFDLNPLLPASAYYPGLELATEGLRAITGLSAHASGLVVLGLARVMTALGIIVLIERLTRSNRAACIAVLVYATNPQFLFFNSNFSYQSLALPLGIVVLAVLLGVNESNWRTSFALASVCSVAVVVTHHLTSFGLALILAAWWCEETFRGRQSARRRTVGLTALVTAGGVVGWLLVTGDVVVAYLRGIATGTWRDISAQLSGHGGRALFTDYGGTTTPIWERIASVSAVLVILVALAVAMILYGRDLLARGAPAAILLAAAVLYPVIPAGHLTRASAELSDRFGGFIFVGLAALLGVAIHRATTRMNQRWKGLRRPSGAIRVSVGFVILAGVVFVGGTISGAGPDWNRMPGPYLVSADSRSVDAANLDAARYARRHLPAGSRVLTDRVNRLILAAHGDQLPITSLENGIDVSPVMSSPTFDRAVRKLVRAENVEFVEVDRRLSTGLPRVGIYFEQNEPGAYHHVKPLSRRALDKFAQVARVARVYDNGAVSIYDLRGLHE